MTDSTKPQAQASFESMKVVYIAGPFRASSAWLIEQNVRRAEQAAFDVASLGAMPMCPHTNTRFFHGTLSEQFWIDGTKALLLRCDAVYLVEGWECSIGSLGERDEAERRRLPCFQSMIMLASWIKGNP